MKKEGTEIDRKLIAEIVLQCVARDAAYEYTGKSLDMERQWLVLAGHYIEGRIEEDQLADPFRLINWYKEHPNSVPLLWAYESDVIKNQQSYEAFVSWFRERLEQEVAARREGIEASPAYRGGEVGSSP